MFTINIGGLQRSGKTFLAALNREVDDAVESAGEHAKQHVERHSSFKRRSGSPHSLKDATEYKVVRLKSGRVVKVKSKKKTAAFLEHGTRPHIIRARRKKMLRFVAKGGGIVFARAVHHPGTRGTHFLWNATNAAFRFAGHALDTAMSRAARRF